MDIVCQPAYSVYSITSTEICCTVSELSQWATFLYVLLKLYKKGCAYSSIEKYFEALLCSLTVLKISFREKIYSAFLGN